MPLPGTSPHATRCVHIVEDDDVLRDTLASLLRSVGLGVQAFASTDEFLAAPPGAGPCCLVLDVRLRGSSGLALQQSLLERGGPPPAIVFMSGHADVAMTVRAMKAGATDFLVKPFRDQDMIDAVIAALDADARRLEAQRARDGLRACWESLTPRETEVMLLVASGLLNKQIAAEMGIAEITAKIHRGQAMRKMQVRSVAELVRRMQALGVLETAC